MARRTKSADSLPRIPEHSPTVAGRWLANDLRKLRLAVKLKQEDAARELRCSRVKIGHLESGHTPVRRPDLLVLLPLYGVPQHQQVWYLDLCDKAHQKGWWDGADGVPSWFSLYVGLEWGAELISSYDMGMVPGLLQTPEYARAIIESGFPDDPEHVERLVEQRIQRQAVLTRDSEPLEIDALLDEAVLRRKVLDRPQMRRQLEYLLEIAEHPQVTLRVVPFGGAPHPGQLGSFKILDFPSVDDPGVVYLETRIGGLYLEENDELGEYRQAFFRLARLALSVEETKSFIQKVARSRT